MFGNNLSIWSIEKKLYQLYVLLLFLLYFTPCINAQKSVDADSLNKEAVTLFFEDKEHSYEIAQKALKLAVTVNDKNQEARAHINFARYFIDRKDFIQALDSLYRVVPYLNEIVPNTASLVLNLISESHKGLRNDSVVFRKYLRNLEQSERLDHSFHLLMSLTDYFIENSNYKKANEYLKKSEVVIRQLKDNRLRKEIDFRQGQIAFFLRDFKEAIRLLKSFKFDPSDSTHKFVRALHLIGSSYYYLDDYDSALDTYIRAKKVTVDQPHLRLETLKSLGQISSIQGDYTSAENYLKKALDLALGKDDFEKAELFNELAKTCLSKRKTHEALQYFDSTAIYARKYRLFHFLKEALVGKAACCEKEGRYKDASYLFRQALIASEKVFEQNKEAAIAEADAYYNNLYKSAKVDELKQDKLVQQLMLKQKKTINRFLVIILIGTFVAFTVLIWFYVQKRKLNLQLREKNQQIANSYEELRVINDHLANSKKSLQKSNYIKDRFFSIIAHDVKSPLTAIRSLIFVLQKQFQNTEQQSEFLKQIDQTSESLVDLLNNLLNWAVTQTDRMQVRPQHILVSKLIAKSIKLHKTTIEAKGIHIDLKVDDRITIMSDKNMLNLIIRNLMSNAVKFTPDQGTVSIGLHVDQGKVLFDIKDTGPGIADDLLKRIFSIEKRVRLKSRKEGEGTGLGLTLCRSFTKLLGGKIWAESEEGVGSTFYLSLPKSIENHE